MYISILLVCLTGFKFSESFALILFQIRISSHNGVPMHTTSQISLILLRVLEPQFINVFQIIQNRLFSFIEGFVMNISNSSQGLFRAGF
jgi:hypothetical protein